MAAPTDLEQKDCEVQLPDYAWICHSCKASNGSGLEVCAVCGLMAVATGAEIEEAVTGVSRQSLPSRRELTKRRKAEMAALPFWKKQIAYLLRGVQFVGSLVFVFGIFDPSGTQILLGIGVTSVAELFFQLLKGRFPENSMLG
jgi:hypothetical protein